MTDTSPAPMTQSDILKGAALSGVINAVINGAIQFFLLRGDTPMPLTVDSIGTETHTVLGASVPLGGSWTTAILAAGLACFGWWSVRSRWSSAKAG